MLQRNVLLHQSGELLVQAWQQTPGVYIPQLGDEVVYLKDGHQKYFKNINDKRRGPWDTIVSTAVRAPWASITDTTGQSHASAHDLKSPLLNFLCIVLSVAWCGCL